MLMGNSLCILVHLHWLWINTNCGNEELFEEFASLVLLLLWDGVFALLDFVFGILQVLVDRLFSLLCELIYSVIFGLLELDLFGVQNLLGLRDFTVIFLLSLTFLLVKVVFELFRTFLVLLLGLYFGHLLGIIQFGLSFFLGLIKNSFKISDLVCHILNPSIIIE